MNHPQVEQVIQKADEFLAAYPTLCQYGACHLFLRLEIDRQEDANGYFFSCTVHFVKMSLPSMPNTHTHKHVDRRAFLCDGAILNVYYVCC